MDTLLLGLAFDIFSALCTALNTLFLIFLNLANTSTQVLEITKWAAIKENIYIIISVVMIFYLTINFLTYLVSPEKLTDKSSGAQKTIIKIIISVALLVFTPTVFSLSRDLQTAILKENVLGKIIMSTDNKVGNDKFQSFSKTISTTLVKAFLTSKTDPTNKEVMDSDFISTGITSMVELRDIATNKGTHDFNWIMAIASSAILCLLIFGFLFDIAIRLVKLMFMELIAPIPIMMYPISKKGDGAFSKWVKACTSTYASLFIRLALIYFALYFIDYIDADIRENNAVIYSFIIIGALLFVKQLPQLIGDIFGIKMDGKFTLNPMARIREVPLLGSAVHTVGAAAGGLVTGTALGFRAAGGFKGIGSAFKEEGFLGGMKNIGTMTGMSTRGMIFGGRAGFKQTSLFGQAVKDQKIDKGAYRAGASSVAQAITGNKDASAGFPDRIFNNMATHLNDPSYNQKKVIGDAEKDYDKAVQQLSVLQDSEREIKSNLDVSIERRNSLNADLTRINTQITNLSNPTTLTARVAAEKTRINTQISSATGRLITTTDAADRTALQKHIDELREQLNGVDENVENNIRHEISELTAKRADVQMQYNQADAAANSYTVQHNEITARINGGTIIDPTTGASVHVNGAINDVADAKKHVKDEKDKLKYMNSDYNERK